MNREARNRIEHLGARDMDRHVRPEARDPLFQPRQTISQDEERFGAKAGRAGELIEDDAAFRYEPVPPPQITVAHIAKGFDPGIGGIENLDDGRHGDAF